mmetsp:Transcript_41087/g.132154  ORF Transcript_41087/g.132154 Transcript_41087/m.132154 type:complete len:294 (+) Transcript_41087:703-1584(+)
MSPTTFVCSGFEVFQQPLIVREGGVAELARDIRRIHPASERMSVSLCTAQRGEDAELGHEHCFAKLAAVAIHRIHVALDRMSIPKTRAEKSLATKAGVRRIPLTAHFMGIPLCPAIRHDHAHQSETCLKEAAAMRTLEPVGWILLASSSMLVPCSLIRKDVSAEACVLRVPLAPLLMHITRSPAIVCAKAQHVESCDERAAAELALKTIHRIRLTLGGVSIPGIGIRKQPAAKALVRGIVLATHYMSISRGTSICSKKTFHPILRHELQGAVRAFESVDGIHLAGRGMVVPCN